MATMMLESPATLKEMYGPLREFVHEVHAQSSKGARSGARCSTSRSKAG
ncbi:MAG: hypothetical protein KIS78_27680 [Labilithrix sp.]|nr:hypothetical protein [Labilithrix sp.]